MDVETMHNLSIIIKKEKLTNNILFMLKNMIPDMEEAALKHSKLFYSLAKLFSNTGFNIELEGPRYIDLTRDQVITMLLDDISAYSDLIKKNDSTVIPILSELMKIKIAILKSLVLEIYSTNNIF